MSCPVCGSGSSVSLIDTMYRPLSVTVLKDKAGDSLSLPKHRIEIKACIRCTHVYNAAFDDDAIYGEDGCTMYNNGAAWQKHIHTVASYLNDYKRGRVVEIGAGDGQFLEMINGDRLAFEPSKDYHTLCEKGLPAVRDYFRPHRFQFEEHDLIVMRHVLEHFAYPYDFLDLLNSCVTDQGRRISLYVEVPGIENALDEVRIEDWTYEHPNHFTCSSLIFLLKRAGFDICRLWTPYDGEVICAVAENIFVENNLSHRFSVLKSVQMPDEPAIFWGGAGKSTMMLHHLARHCDKVVDSDQRKWGKYVPGLSLKIQSPDIVTDDSHVIITTNWREDDIRADIASRGLNPTIYTFKNGKLHAS